MKPSAAASRAESRPVIYPEKERDLTIAVAPNKVTSLSDAGCTGRSDFLRKTSWLPELRPPFSQANDTQLLINADTGQVNPSIHGGCFLATKESILFPLPS